MVLQAPSSPNWILPSAILAKISIWSVNQPFFNIPMYLGKKLNNYQIEEQFIHPTGTPEREEVRKYLFYLNTVKFIRFYKL